jgi:hypothetical protein
MPEKANAIEMRVFENKFKTDGLHPDYSQKNVDVKGSDMDVSVWKNVAKNGSEYLNIRIVPAYKSKEEAAKSKEEAAKRKNQGEQDDLPF